MITPRWTPGIERVLQGMRDTEGWVLYSEGRIRRPYHSQHCCPVSSLDGVGAGLYLKVAQRHGIDSRSFCIVVATADNDIGDLHYNPALRAAMLEAGRIET